LKLSFFLAEVLLPHQCRYITRQKTTATLTNCLSDRFFYGASLSYLCCRYDRQQLLELLHAVTRQLTAQKSLCHVDTNRPKRLHLGISGDELAHNRHASENKVDLVLADT
jgi:hypothetical protein